MDRTIYPDARRFKFSARARNACRDRTSFDQDTSRFPVRPTPVAPVVIFVCSTRERTRIIRRSRRVAEPSGKPAATVLAYESVCQHRGGTQRHQTCDTARNECSLKYAHGSFPPERISVRSAKQHATSLGRLKDVSAAVGPRRKAGGASLRASTQLPPWIARLVVSGPSGGGRRARSRTAGYVLSDLVGVLS